MANFLENLRNSQTLIPRNGERLFQKVDPVAKLKWEKADMSGLNREAEKQFNMTAEDRAGVSRNKNMAAHNNTLFVNNDPTKNAAWLDLDPDTLPFKDFGVAQNSERLAQVLDEYDSKDNWDDRIKVIEKSWKKFPDASRGVTNWLLNLESLTDTARNPNGRYPGTAKDISNIMRRITQEVRDSFIQKA